MFNKTWRSFILFTGETALLVTAVVISSVVVGGAYAWELLTDNTAIFRVLLIVVVCQLCLHYSDLYDLRTVADKRDVARRLLQAIGATSLILGIAYWLFPLLVVEQGVFLLTAVLAILLVMAWRSLFDVVIARLAPRERLLLVGTGRPRCAREGAVRAARNSESYRRFHRSRSGARWRAGYQSRRDRHDRRHSAHRCDHRCRPRRRHLTDARGRLPMDKLLDDAARTGVRSIIWRRFMKSTPARSRSRTCARAG